MRQIGHVANGPSFDVVENNGYLYAAQGSEVRIYDVSTDQKIVDINWKLYKSKIYAGSLVQGLSLTSNYLYIASDMQFIIIDVSNPLQPIKVSFITNPSNSSRFRDVEIKGDYAYLTNYGSGITIINIQNIQNPILVKTFSLGGSNHPWRMTIEGNYLYVTLADDNSLYILDITSPISPTIKGKWISTSATTNDFSSVAVKGNYAYVIQYHVGLYVLNISNPAVPTKVSGFVGAKNEYNYNDIKLYDNYAFVSVRYQGFDIINISNSTNITPDSIVGHGRGTKGYSEGIFVRKDGNIVFLADESYGIEIYNSTTKNSPAIINRINVIGGSDSIDVKDSYLYIGAHNDGDWIVDVRDPANPMEVAFIKTGGRNIGIDVQNDYMYVAEEWSGLNIIKVTDKTNPVWLVKGYDNAINNVLSDGNYLYTTIGIVNISNPASPKYLSKSSNFKGESVRYSYKYLLIASSGGIKILNIANKSSPVLVKTFGSGAYTDIKVTENIAVAIKGNSIRTINLSNISNPTSMNTKTYTGWTGTAIDINGNTVYAVGDGSKDVRIFDISNPSNIALKDTFDIPVPLWTAPSDVIYNNGKIYVATKSGVNIIVE